MQLEQQQVHLQEALAAKAALQRQCDDLQWQLQQQDCRRSAGFCSSQMEDMQHLAEIAALQGQKQQLQQEVRHGSSIL
jgi:hypothetical protein